MRAHGLVEMEAEGKNPSYVAGILRKRIESRMYRLKGDDLFLKKISRGT